MSARVQSPEMQATSATFRSPLWHRTALALLFVVHWRRQTHHRRRRRRHHRHHHHHHHHHHRAASRAPRTASLHTAPHRAALSQPLRMRIARPVRCRSRLCYASLRPSRISSLPPPLYITPNPPHRTQPTTNTDPLSRPRVLFCAAASALVHVQVLQPSLP